MAEETEEKTPSEPPLSKGEKFKKLLAKPAVKWAGIILLIISVLGGISFATLNYLGVFDEAENAKQMTENTNESLVNEVSGGVKESVIASYYPFEPKFVVNFMARGRQRFMQLGLSLRVPNAEAIAFLTQHEPLLKNSLIMLISSQDFMALHTDTGRQNLQKEILNTVRKIMTEEVGDPVVEQVYFTDYVMQ
jgi:flagellar FliL protein